VWRTFSNGRRRVPRFLDSLLGFGRALRREGIDAHPAAMLTVVEALAQVDVAARDQVYHACRALVVHRPEQIPTFDRVFGAFWRAEPLPGPRDAASGTSTVAHATATAEILEGWSAEAAAEAEDGPVERSLRTWSERGGIANKAFTDCTPAELASVAAALSTMTWTPGLRRTRRWERGRGPRIDMRRAVAASRRTGGDLAVLPRRRRRTTPRPLVVLCDVSGSMEQYSRMMLLFTHAVARRLSRVEAFLFSTELTRVTHELHQRNPDAALAALSRVVPDWSGGTRIGHALATFHQRWARRVLNGGAVVLLISDGWDRGQPEDLRREIARLQRRCHRLIWLSPLIGTDGYEPLTRGLQAALPHVDDFLPARTLRNFADLAGHLNDLDPARSL
jgi:uncharacterized protein with von Willebrand factor type A (vWA) domain